MNVVSVINYKGGVGKTTLTANIAAELARRFISFSIAKAKPLVFDIKPACFKFAN